MSGRHSKRKGRYVVGCEVGHAAIGMTASLHAWRINGYRRYSPVLTGNVCMPGETGRLACTMAEIGELVVREEGNMNRR